MAASAADETWEAGMWGKGNGRTVTLAAAALALGGMLGAAPAAAVGAIPSDFNGDGYSDLAIGVPAEDLNGIEEAGMVQVLYGSFFGLSTAGNQLLTQGNGLHDAPESHDGFGSAFASGDFNADGYDDLAIGVPGEDLFDDENAGAVHVLYGSSGGLQTSGSRFWYQGWSAGLSKTARLQDSPEDQDAFGAALAAGNFGKGAADDLAVGAPGETVWRSWARTHTGAVSIVFGSSSGLTPTGSQLFTLDNTGSATQTTSGARFGRALAAADFGRSTEDDLAIGAPGYSSGRGIVIALSGSEAGLVTPTNRLLTQTNLHGSFEDEPQDLFGYSLAAGDFDGDGPADLAIGAPAEDKGGTENVGAVYFADGSRSGGLSNAGPRGWSLTRLWQATSGVPGDSEGGDWFGASLAAGNFGGGSADDLAIGAPLEDIEASDPDDDDSGSVYLLYGRAGGLTGEGSIGLSQRDNLPGDPEDNEWTGWALAAGNYGSGPEDDLVISCPGESTGESWAGTGGTSQAGVVHQLWGTPDGLSTSDSHSFSQNTSGLLRENGHGTEANDRFGLALG